MKVNVNKLSHTCGSYVGVVYGTPNVALHISGQSQSTEHVVVGDRPMVLHVQGGPTSEATFWLLTSLKCVSNLCDLF